MQVWKARGSGAQRVRSWNWTFWAAIVAFEALGLLLNSQA